ncbi:hypothetical protein RHECNPAF_140015 [Rhizobium etli CNPAF512]|nr:hypothetical protein RHECNPAF_140015 [Rhizobium etli CNPAF512]
MARTSIAPTVRDEMNVVGRARAAEVWVMRVPFMVGRRVNACHVYSRARTVDKRFILTGCVMLDHT